MILEALNLSLGNDFWGVNCYWFWRVGSSQMKHATKMILKHQNSNICKWSQKKMILRNDFRIPTPQKKRFTKVGVMKNSWEVKVWPLQLELAVLKCLEVIDLVEKAMSAWAINLKILWEIEYSRMWDTGTILWLEVENHANIGHVMYSLCHTRADTGRLKEQFLDRDEGGNLFEKSSIEKIPWRGFPLNPRPRPRPSLLSASTVTLASRSRSTTKSWPFAAAKCSGVLPQEPSRRQNPRERNGEIHEKILTRQKSKFWEL